MEQTTGRNDPGQERYNWIGGYGGERGGGSLVEEDPWRQISVHLVMAICDTKDNVVSVAKELDVYVVEIFVVFDSEAG